MKEFLPRQTKTITDPDYRPLPSNYVKAKKRDNPMQKVNENIEYQYFKVIERIKKLYATLPNESDRLVYQKDHTKEKISPCGVYTFITSHCFLYFEVDVLLRYRVEYQLHNCPVEKEVLLLLKPLIANSYASEKVRHPDFAEFFKRVKEVQPEHLFQQL
ncbi:hypothetical protein [Pedobacter nyackensis]|uniref:hypothetical protein n=1 Tax=Pedobacter nyackensis TaxID=475255 RepID=UPI00292F52F1|nr:hypothetical protein [Pedobacter nyackensis]